MGAVRSRSTQFRHDPVIQGTAADVVGAAHRQLRRAGANGPTGPRLRRGSPPCALGLASIAELPYQRRILAALPGASPRGLAVFQTTACGDGFVGTILQVTDQGRVAVCMAWKTSPRQGTSGKASACPARNPPAKSAMVGVGSEAPFAQFQQAYAPSIGVAVLFRTEQVAVCVEATSAPDQHRPAGLEDLVVGAEGRTAARVLPER